MLALKRIADVDAVADRELERDVGEQFEAGTGRRPPRSREIDSSLERIRRRCQADEGGLDRARLRKQLQRRGGDDAERAFAPMKRWRRS